MAEIRMGVQRGQYYEHINHKSRHSNKIRTLSFEVRTHATNFRTPEMRHGMMRTKYSKSN